MTKIGDSISSVTSSIVKFVKLKLSAGRFFRKEKETVTGVKKNNEQYSIPKYFNDHEDKSEEELLEKLKKIGSEEEEIESNLDEMALFLVNYLKEGIIKTFGMQNATHELEKLNTLLNELEKDSAKLKTEIEKNKIIMQLSLVRINKMNDYVNSVEKNILPLVKDFILKDRFIVTIGQLKFNLSEYGKIYNIEGNAIIIQQMLNLNNSNRILTNARKIIDGMLDAVKNVDEKLVNDLDKKLLQETRSLLVYLDKQKDILVQLEEFASRTLGEFAKNIDPHWNKLNSLVEQWNSKAKYQEKEKIAA